MDLLLRSLPYRSYSAHSSLQFGRATNNCDRNDLRKDPMEIKLPRKMQPNRYSCRTYDRIRRYSNERNITLPESAPAYIRKTWDDTNEYDSDEKLNDVLIDIDLAINNACKVLMKKMGKIPIKKPRFKEFLRTLLTQQPDNHDLWIEVSIFTQVKSQGSIFREYDCYSFFLEYTRSI